MANNRLHNLSPAFKWAISAYFLLTAVGFLVAGLISHQRYDFDHGKTATYFLGNESEMIYPKLYSQLIQIAHVHSFTLPMVFLTLWIAMVFIPMGETPKKMLILGGALSILIYNGAPFMVRYQSADWVFLFTLGGVGLYLFFFLPLGFLLYETWFGFSHRRGN